MTTSPVMTAQWIAFDAATMLRNRFETWDRPVVFTAPGGFATAKDDGWDGDPYALTFPFDPQWSKERARVAIRAALLNAAPWFYREAEQREVVAQSPSTLISDGLLFTYGIWPTSMSRA